MVGDVIQRGLPTHREFRTGRCDGVEDYAASHTWPRIFAGRIDIGQHQMIDTAKGVRKCGTERFGAAISVRLVRGNNAVPLTTGSRSNS